MKLNTLNEVDWTGFRSTNISRAYSEAEVELQEDDSLEEVWDDFQDAVNITASELERWSGNPCSREASVDPRSVIERNLRLLSKNKSDWTDGDVKDAKRTISFIARMKPNKPDSPKDGSFGCPSEWAISLLNWAYNPFESIPEIPDNDDLEDVDPIEMDDKEELGAEERLERPNYEFEPVPSQVLYETKERAQERAESIGLEGVHTHKFGAGQTMYMPGDTHSEWMAFVRGKKGKSVRSDEKRPTRRDSEMVRDAEEVFNSQDMSEKEDSDSNAVRTEPSTIHEISEDDE